MLLYSCSDRDSDIPSGKSGGDRLIYQLFSPQCVLLLLIYAKSDRADVAAEEIEAASQLPTLTAFGVQCGLAENLNLVQASNRQG
ncbi:hypothetical protein [Scytonema sp. UIC 10036]|uniref:hypothetical protein n=1 Tax=Scytonema sp. UIC 10036 TaxID=2304196 RepID=UPI001A9A9C8E|nr:hypothetical protein [Scytonema sp. UIC 10036]